MSSITPKRIVQKLVAVATSAWKVHRTEAQTKHVSGPKKIVLGDSDVVLVCLMKNAEYYIQHLLEHHRSLGVKHFLLIDNGSSDSTRSLVSSQPDVTVYENLLPPNRYECLLRSKIARRVVSGGWFLFVDTDELVRFCREEGRCISDFAAYCNSRNYDAVVGQVLDVFSSSSLNETASWTYADSIQAFNQYSLNAISKYDYHDATNVEFHWHVRDNVISNQDIKFMFGGMRNEIFGENCCLTTHRFVKNASHIELYTHPHCSNNVTCADFTFLIKHYKFAGDYWDREVRQIQNSTWEHGEDVRRMATLEKQKHFTLFSPHQKELASVEELVDRGFLACSAEYFSQFPKVQ